MDSARRVLWKHFSRCNVRILFFGNNWVGWQTAAWLRARDAEIVGVVLHPRERQRYGEEIIGSAAVAPACIFDGTQLSDPAVLHAISALEPDIGVSALFGYILKRPLLDLLPRGCVNLHTSLLPYNRGAHPNVWSIVEQAPAGVTLHYIDEGVDTGDIVAQRQVAVEPIDTGESLYHKLEHAAVELFAETWPLLCAGEAARMPQARAAGTCHRVRDIAQLDEIDLDRSYTARDLINILRARSFPPYRGAYFRDGQRNVYLELRLRYED